MHAKSTSSVPMHGDNTGVHVHSQEIVFEFCRSIANRSRRHGFPQPQRVVVFVSRLRYFLLLSHAAVSDCQAIMQRSARTEYLYMRPTSQIDCSATPPPARKCCELISRPPYSCSVVPRLMHPLDVATVIYFPQRVVILPVTAARRAP